MYNEDQILIIKERKDVKNLTNKIKKVIFPEGFTDIDFEDLIGKNLKDSIKLLILSGYIIKS